MGDKNDTDKYVFYYSFSDNDEAIPLPRTGSEADADALLVAPAEHSRGHRPVLREASRRRHDG